MPTRLRLIPELRAEGCYPGRTLHKKGWFFHGPDKHQPIFSSLCLLQNHPMQPQSASGITASAGVPSLGRQGKTTKDVPEEQGEASLTRQRNTPINKRQEKHEISSLLLRRAAASWQQGQGHFLVPYFRCPLCLSFPNRAKATSNNTRQILTQTLGKGEGHLTAQQHPKHTISNREQGTGMRGTCRGEPDEKKANNKLTLSP